MMIKKFIIGVILFLVAFHVRGQVIFHNQGTIKFERKTNGFRLTEGSWMNKMYEKEKFRTDTFTLVFDSLHSVYSDPQFSDEEGNTPFWFSMNLAPDRSNLVYKNMRSDSVIAIRQLFDEKISITDSIRNIRWKITGETRDIAGFQCQKAIGILYDSMYVVAFYTDQILPENGPETFGGLPGMILGLAVPRLYTSWMAISFDPTITEIHKPVVPRKKKTQFNWNSYQTSVSERFHDWGEPYRTLFVWMWGM